MKVTHLLFYPALLVFALSCGQATTAQESETTDTTTETTETAEPESDAAGAYTITVLNADLPSPRKEMTGSIGDVDITINYGSPSVRSRTIWGGLEPYGEVWRTGANEATTIQFSNDVQIEGEALAAGRYGLFTIPDKKSWTVIFNSAADQWGDFEYDEAKDVLRVEVKPRSESDNAEQMDFLIEENAVVMRWEKITVPFKIAAPE